MNAIGIMQGRLSPPGSRPQMFPVATWRDEFTQARDCGFDLIEWLVSAAGLEHNPLLIDGSQVRALVAGSGVAVRTICADCFIARPFAPNSGGDPLRTAALLRRIVQGAAATGATIVTVPMLETNAVASAAELADVLSTLSAVMAEAAGHAVRIAIESDLRAADLIQAATAAGVDICYDLGNAAALGRDIAAELVALRGHLAVVHVKDRRHDGDSVPLGTGAVDFDGAFAALRAIGFDGPCILETPPGHDPVDAAARHLDFVKHHLTGTKASA